MLCRISLYENWGGFIFCDKGKKLNGPQEAPWSPCLNEGQSCRSPVPTTLPEQQSPFSPQPLSLPR